MMMKKFLLMMLCLLLALPFVCAAEDAAPTATPVPILPTFEWERNPGGHWRMLENGERADLGGHQFGDDLLCTICGAEVWVYDDLSGEVYDYDAYGNLVRQTSYASDGAITYESVQALTYDEDGHLIHALEFIDGVLFGESTFTLSPEGEVVPVSQYAWYDDGTWALNEFDEYGNCIRAVAYNADDTIASETLSEYKQGSWGWFYESKSVTYMGDSTFLAEYNEYGDKTRSYMADAGVAWSDHVYEYGYKDGTKLWRKDYDQGKLRYESIFDPETEMLVKETEYYDDGTCTVSEFNRIGDPEKITFLTAEGTVEMTQTFEYVYDEYECQLSCKSYVDGTLVLLSEYACTEDGWPYLARETLYNGDGSYLICVYDENDELVSETGYDAQGNVIE